MCVVVFACQYRFSNKNMTQTMPRPKRLVNPRDISLKKLMPNKIPDKKLMQPSIIRMSRDKAMCRLAQCEIVFMNAWF